MTLLYVLEQQNGMDEYVQFAELCLVKWDDEREGDGLVMFGGQ